MQSHDPEREQDPKPGTKARSAADLLREWRDAERAVDAAEPGSAQGRMSREQAEHAREVFHDTEDAAHVRHGDPLPRKGDSTPEDEAKEA